jgi:hypothetical protein
VLGCRHREIARSRMAEIVREDVVRTYTNRATKELKRRFVELGNGTVDSLAPAPDDLVPIADVVRSLEQTGEVTELACLQADLDAAGFGRLLRSSLSGTELEADLASELDVSPPDAGEPESLALTDEEVAHLLGTEAA